MAFSVSSGSFVDIQGMTVKSISIVFDKGQDTGPDNFGLAVLDNIDVNGRLVGSGGALAATNPAYLWGEGGPHPHITRRLPGLEPPRTARPLGGGR